MRLLRKDIEQQAREFMTEWLPNWQVYCIKCHGSNCKNNDVCIKCGEKLKY